MQDYQDYFDYNDEEEAKNLRTFLEFVISGRIFAIETKDVVEIVQLEKITPVPEFPKYVLGIQNVKGESLAVIDSAYRFGLAQDENLERRCVIVCNANGKKIGILADDVLKLKDVKEENISDSPKINNEAFTRYITCMYLTQAGDPCFAVSPVLMMSEDEQKIILS